MSYLPESAEKNVYLRRKYNANPLRGRRSEKPGFAIARSAWIARSSDLCFSASAFGVILPRHRPLLLGDLNTARTEKFNHFSIIKRSYRNIKCRVYKNRNSIPIRRKSQIKELQNIVIGIDYADASKYEILDEETSSSNLVTRHTRGRQNDANTKTARRFCRRWREQSSPLRPAIHLHTVHGQFC